MRSLVVATLLASVFGGSSAFAQDTYVHHNWCLMVGSGQECAYQTLATCKAAKHNPTDRCVRNTAPRNH
jgi:hypothetical protein